MVREVQRGLLPQPRSLPAWMFYDALGTRLFERITHLAEYYPTRTERGIFSGYADTIVSRARGESSKPLRIVELGAGTASKTGILLDAAAHMQGRVEYIPVDVSETALEAACASIEQSLADVEVKPVVANYVSAPIQLAPHDGPTLALYIGSSIGNFSPEEQRTILRNLKVELQSGDALLLGVDMVKDRKVMEAAYRDAEGVTEAFNLNILRRLNKELAANFDLACFRHVAFWNKDESRIEMHLEAIEPQHIRIAAARLSVRLAKGERIHTENSYKFTENSLLSLLEDSGYFTEETWTDERGWFSVTLARVV
ncbi:MAG: L-histidine N(alpha)-methyltransferase [Acidobacteria bacterium]|nr:L-histidine N(alpha)-methyltransferase [Acidobacteriota bacterium]